MASKDVFQAIDTLDENRVERIVNRLEARGKDPKYMRWANEYLDAAAIDDASSVLDIGCGTGVLSRTVASRPGFGGSITAVDPSASLLDAGREISGAEGVDRVVAHTTISHVSRPEKLLGEMARVVAPNGMVVLFDGDYASWAFDHPDGDFGKRMEEAWNASIVANPRIMRQLRRLLPKYGLQEQESLEWLYIDTPDGSFFSSAIIAYSDLLAQTGNATKSDVKRWVDYLESAMERSQFFSACNYYAVIATPA